MGRKIGHRVVNALLSFGAAAAIGGAPLAFAHVVRPSALPADTPIVNAGISVNAQNPSDYIHLVASHPDASNHQVTSGHSTTADFVIFLAGITSGAKNFTAPITATWHTQGNGSTSSFTPSSGTATFVNKYAPHYQTIKVPVHFDTALYSEKNGSFASFEFIISSATGASVGQSTAIEYIVRGSGSKLP